MKSRVTSRIVLFAGTALIGCMIMAARGAAQTGGLTLQDVITRLVALEKRVNQLEEKLNSMQQRDDGQAEIAATGPTIEITDPEDGAEVGMNVIVEGIVRVEDLGERWPVVGVHPLLTNMTWIQPVPVKIDKTPAGYRFRCRAYCGTRHQGVGEKFELFALLVDKGQHKEGDQLQRLPADVPISSAVVVTRTRN